MKIVLDQKQITWICVGIIAVTLWQDRTIGQIIGGFWNVGTTTASSVYTNLIMPVDKKPGR